MGPFTHARNFFSSMFTTIHRGNILIPPSKIAEFLNKSRKAKLDFPIDFIGFEIPHKFVVGYGLDFNQKMRHLDEIYYIPDGSDI